MSDLDPSWGQKDRPSSGGGQEAKLRIILAGKSGDGKSATGNTILGQEERFPSVLGATTTTVACQEEKGEWNGWEYSLIDTPAIFDSNVNNKTSLRRECIHLSKPGPHALVFVTQVGRFTAEDEAAAGRVKKVFEMATKHMIVLFTRKEDLGGGSLQDYVTQSDNKALLKLIEECGNRFCAFNNRAAGAERETQVSELMEMVQGMVQDNGGRYCKKHKQSWLEKIRAWGERRRRATKW